MFERIIKIRGKSFDDLNPLEIASMIRADSAISPNGNEYFSACALDEFLYYEGVRRSDLKRLRKFILKHIYVEESESSVRKINTTFLKDLAYRIEASGSIDTYTQIESDA